MKMERIINRLRAFTISRLLLFALVLSACSIIGRGDEGEGGGTAVTFGHETPLSVEAFLMCSQECSDRGFCGTTDTGARMVLLYSQGPSAQNFDVAIPDNTLVPILGLEPQLAMLRSTGEQFSVNYYVISNPANGQAAWVAGWCIGQPQQ
jgi:hypothetical protein